MLWIAKHPQAKREMLGYIPTILQDGDPRPARDQINDRYAHGGGWTPLKEFRLLDNGTIQYPGDSPVTLLYEAILHENTGLWAERLSEIGGELPPTEIIRFYDGSWLAIIQPDGTYEIARID